MPIFDFQNPNITIPEPDGPAEICVTMTGGTTVNITVTAMTGPKSGASDQATGTAHTGRGIYVCRALVVVISC